MTTDDQRISWVLDKMDRTNELLENVVELLERIAHPVYVVNIDASRGVAAEVRSSMPIVVGSAEDIRPDPPS